jgi:hypothetical protein
MVLMGELEFRLFDFNFLTQHCKNINNTQIKTIKGVLSPEITKYAQVFPKTDVWYLGHLLLKVFDSRNRSQVNLSKLKSDPIKELESFFGKNV